MTDHTTLPATGWVRLRHILGDRRRGTPPIVPVSETTWWEGVRTGRFPPGRKLSPRVTVWDARDIRRLIETGDWRDGEGA